jgi:iron complex outermembrane recepter protein
MRMRAAIATTCIVLLGSVITTNVGAAPEPSPESAQKISLDISAQPISDALNEFAHQAGLQVVFYTEIGQGLTAPAVAGNFTAEEALQKLLAGTGLAFQFMSAGTVAIRQVNGGRTTSADVEEGKEIQLAQSENTASRSSPSTTAQMQRQQRDVAEDSQTQLEEIVVTAQKRRERMIDVPQSVTILSASDLSKVGATQFRDWVNSIPGLSYTSTGAGTANVSLRGVTAGADISPTVGIYVDEVPYGNSTLFGGGAATGLDMALFDIERIEVLRGPQGTLYGASTMGGLIKYVTKQPDTRSFKGEALAGLSGTKDGRANYNAAAAINAPIAANSMAVRVSAYESHDGGYVDNITRGENDVNRSDIYGGRVDFLFAPTESLSIRVTGLQQNVDRDGRGESDFRPSAAPLADSLEQRVRAQELFDQRFRMVSGALTYAWDRATLVSSTSYQSVDTLAVNDLSGFLPAVEFAHQRTYSAVTYEPSISIDKLSQEIRLATRGVRSLDWLIGGFYTRESSDVSFLLRPYDLADQPGPTNVWNNTQPARYEEYAAFGDLTWHLSNRVDVTGGVRYAHNATDVSSVSSGLFAGVPLVPSHTTESVATYLANMRYRFTDRSMAYLRYATGYRPGGPGFTTPSPVTGLPVGPPTFEPDSLKSYEVGFKSESDDRRLGVDLAAYHIDWSNIQLTVNEGGINGVINAPGGAISDGAELTLTARPFRAFTATAAFAYQDARLAEADSDLRGAKGERLPNVSRFSAVANADYELPMDVFRPMLGVSLRYVGDRTSGFSGVPVTYYRLPSYTVLDLRTSFTFGSIGAQLYVRNLFDERGQLSSAGAGVFRTLLLQPRTVGVSVTASF